MQTPVLILPELWDFSRKDVPLSDRSKEKSIHSG